MRNFNQYFFCTYYKFQLLQFKNFIAKNTDQDIKKISIRNDNKYMKKSDDQKWGNVSFGLRNLLTKMDDKIFSIKANLGL